MDEKESARTIKSKGSMELKSSHWGDGNTAIETENESQPIRQRRQPQVGDK